MSAGDDWWRRPRRITVVVDNESWVLPYAREVVATLKSEGDDAVLAREHAAVSQGAVAIYLGCVRITPPAVLARNRRNLVVHASDLPRGRGFSPWTWQVLEGRSRIPVCLIEAAEQVDAGPVIYREAIELAGHELVDELRRAIGELSVRLCLRFLAERAPPVGEPQVGEGSVYPRRRPEDSRLDPALSLAQQFDLLRVVDNVAYPAWFEHRGCKYKLTIEKMRS